MLWYINNPPVYRWEPDQALYEKYLPMIWLSDAASGWHSVGDEYLKDIRDRLEMEPQVVTLAQKLTKGLENRPGKINTLANYVQKTYTYKALEFGRRAYIPNKASRIIVNKYGDCKDHALLFHQLLKALNIPSYLALVNLGGSVQSQMPTVDQFDHMILYIPGDNDGHFIDTTNKGIDMRIKVPALLAGKQALVLDPNNIRLVKIPDYETGCSRMHVRKYIDVAAGKEMKIKETITLTGYAASFMREFLKSYDVSGHSEWAHQLMSRYLDSYDLKSFNVENMYDNSKDLVVKLTYEINEPARRREQGFILKLPGAWETYYLEVSDVKERKTPFELTMPFELKSVCRVKVSPRYVLDIDDRNEGILRSGKQEAPFAWWETKVQATSSEMMVRFNCRLIPGEFESKEYSGYSDMMDKALKSISAEFGCQKTGK
jgi:hypothetical protein